MLKNNIIKRMFIIGLPIIAFFIVEAVRRGTYDVTNVFINILITIIVFRLYKYVLTTINQLDSQLDSQLIPTAPLSRITSTSKPYKQKFKNFIMPYKPRIIFMMMVSVFIIDNFSDSGADSLAQNQAVKSIKDTSFFNSLIQKGIKTPIIEEVLDRGFMYFIIISITTYILRWIFRKNESNFIYLLSIIIYITLSSLLFGLGHVTKIHWYIPTEWNTSIIQWEKISGYVISGILLSLIFVLFNNKIVAIMLTSLLHIASNISSIIIIKYSVDGITCILIFALIVAFISVFIACSKEDFRLAINAIKHK